MGVAAATVRLGVGCREHGFDQFDIGFCSIGCLFESVGWIRLYMLYRVDIVCKRDCGRGWGRMQLIFYGHMTTRGEEKVNKQLNRQTEQNARDLHLDCN